MQTGRMDHAAPSHLQSEDRKRDDCHEPNRPVNESGAEDRGAAIAFAHQVSDSDCVATQEAEPADEGGIEKPTDETDLDDFAEANLDAATAEEKPVPDLAEPHQGQAHRRTSGDPRPATGPDCHLPDAKLAGAKKVRNRARADRDLDAQNEDALFQVPRTSHTQWPYSSPPAFAPERSPSSRSASLRTSRSSHSCMLRPDLAAASCAILLVSKVTPSRLPK